MDQAGEDIANSGQQAETAGQASGIAQEAAAAATTQGTGQAAQKVVVIEETITETVIVAPAVNGGTAAVEAGEHQPRKRRKLLTGMAVVWKHFGLASRGDAASDGIVAEALAVPTPNST